MTQITASFGKKNHSKTEAYSAQISVELKNESSDIQIRERLDILFGMMRTSVENQLNNIIDCKPVIEYKTVQALPSGIQIQTDKKKPYTKEHSSGPASEKQLSFLKKLASDKNVSLEELVKKNGFNQVSELTSKDCHSIIQEIKNT